MKQKIKSVKRLAVLVVALTVLAVGVYLVYAGTVTDSYDNDNKIAAVWNISTSTSGQIQLAEKECDVFNWYCSASTTCANYLGDGDYIIVAQNDAGSSKQWKATNTACDRPECGADGGQDGDNLVADNTVDFTSYPARDYCQSIGGRLPTIDELQCICDHKASFGDNFGAGNYWSSTEYSGTSARGVNFSSCSPNYNDKTSTLYVRCVKGW